MTNRSPKLYKHNLKLHSLNTQIFEALEKKQLTNLASTRKKKNSLEKCCYRLDCLIQSGCTGFC